VKRHGEKSALQAIDKHGALLVFPVDNKREPLSIWSCFYPRSPMRWEWDEDGDNRVAGLWHLRADLSTTRKAVYVKWYQGRATYLSRPLFTALLRALNPDLDSLPSLSPTARKILSILEGESPLSTKELKRAADLKGRDNEASFNRAMKELWSRLLIVAFGEVDDGAFPSLAVGATRVLFEDLWKKAADLDRGRALAGIGKILPPRNPFALFFEKLLKQQQHAPARPRGRERAAAARTAKPKSPSVVSFEDLV
jgi:hypothetical protein